MLRENKRAALNEVDTVFFFATDSSKCILFFKDLWEPQPISFMAFPAHIQAARKLFFAEHTVGTSGDELLAHNSYM